MVVEYNQVIVVDPAVLEDDYDSESDNSSQYTTETLEGMAYEYRFENGRRYHAHNDGKYAIPNDEAEQDRLDIMHHVYLLLFKGQLHLAPISSTPRAIMDVGTGTGIWAIDVAERYPSAHVIGTDLSPIQSSFAPPNVEFRIHDAEGEWTFGEDVFDLIHSRNLEVGIGDWGKMIKEVYRALKPGGWVELAEIEFFLRSDDGSFKDTSFLWKYLLLVNEAAIKLGRGFHIPDLMEKYIQDAGFVNIQHQKMRVPFGTWPADPKEREVGAFQLLAAESAFEAYGYGLLTRSLGMDIDEVKQLIKLARTESRSRKVHSYTWHHMYWAQKPV